MKMCKKVSPSRAPSIYRGPRPPLAITHSGPIGPSDRTQGPDHLQGGSGSRTHTTCPCIQTQPLDLNGHLISTKGSQLVQPDLT
jgi:hypothetical protein